VSVLAPTAALNLNPSGFILLSPDSSHLVRD
jgi:hypothetical protein